MALSFWVSVGQHHVEAGTHTPFSEGPQPQPGHRHTYDQQANAVEGVGDRHRPQAAEDGVGRPQSADDHNGQYQRRAVIQLQELRQIKEFEYRDRARVQHAGNRHQAIAQHKEHHRHAAHALVKACTEKLRQGREGPGEVLRQKEKRHQHCGNRGGYLPTHAAQVVAIG